MSFFTDTAPPAIYTLSLHDALPISRDAKVHHLHLAGARHHDVSRLDIAVDDPGAVRLRERDADRARKLHRSEEHTSELQSLTNLVCRLLLEKKNDTKPRRDISQEVI